MAAVKLTPTQKTHFVLGVVLIEVTALTAAVAIWFLTREPVAAIGIGFGISLLLMAVFVVSRRPRSPTQGSIVE